MRGERGGLRGETREASLATRNSKREEGKVISIHEMLCVISFDDLYDLIRHPHTHTHTYTHTHTHTHTQMTSSEKGKG